MEADKVKLFMQLAGHPFITEASDANPELKKLGAALILSETLEYVIQGLGVKVSFNGQEITDANGLEYQLDENSAVDKKEMLDGLADVAYTMYWNMHAFNLKLEEAFELVADNNLEKFVELKDWSGAEGDLEAGEWDLGCNVSWPEAVHTVTVIKVAGSLYAVGKDKSGKVRKPSTYQSVQLDALL